MGVGASVFAFQGCGGILAICIILIGLDVGINIDGPHGIQCLVHKLDVTRDSEASINENLLAAVVLLRLYEEMTGELHAYSQLETRF
jgi:uncharacterized membrane protein YqgA involved in biofilm formation